MESRVGVRWGNRRDEMIWRGMKSTLQEENKPNKKQIIHRKVKTNKERVTKECDVSGFDLSSNRDK